MSPSSNAYVWGVEVKLDGTPWDRAGRGDLKSFVWRDRINEPPTGRVAFILDSRRDEAPYKAEEVIGKQVVVVLTPPGVSEWDAEGGAVTFEGEVHACEHSGSERGDGEWTLVFRHKAHRLTQKASCKMWQSGDDGDVKLDDIIKQIAGESGLSVSCDASEVTRAAALQYRETDFNFLQRLVEDVGCWMVMHHDDPSKVTITRSPNDAGAVGELDVDDWTVSSAIGPTKLKLVAPPAIKEARVGPYVAEATIANTPAQRAIGDLEVLDAEVGPHDQAEANAAAKSLLHSMGGGTLTVEGTVTGRCLFAGDKIEIPTKAVGEATALNNKFFITDSEVVVDQNGVATTFQAHQSTTDILPARKAIRPRIDGVMRAIVTKSENDIDPWGRIRVKFPWADDEDSAWARIAHDWAGVKRGTFFVPHVDDEVLVAFEHGDPSMPIIIGSLYNSASEPPLTLPGDWTQSIIKTKAEHTLIFEDKDGSEFVEIKTGKKQHYIKLDDANENIEIKSGGGHSLKLDDMGKKIVLKSAGGAELTMDDNGQKVTLKVGGCSIEMAPAGITIKAPQVEVKGDAKVAVEGAMTEVKGSGMLTLKGGVTMIN